MKKLAGNFTARFQRGAVLVEMVLVTPILLFIILATAEVTGVTLIGAALRTEAQNLVVFGNLAGTGAPVLPGLTTADVQVTDLGTNNVEVTVAHNITGILGPVLRSFNGGADIPMFFTAEATVTMRAL
jgi:hypothetical protein